MATHAQNAPIFADTTKLKKRVAGSGNELQIENSTRTVKGFLLNYDGAGNTRFAPGIDTFYSSNDTLYWRFTTSSTLFYKKITGTGGGNYVDTFWRTPGIDSFYYTINGNTYAILDSTGAGSTTLASLTDVNLTSLADGQLLKYDNATGKWINYTPAIQEDVTGTEYTVNDLLNTPPGSPTTGDAYLVGTSPTGAWASNANNIATWNGSSWDFTAPATGDYGYTVDDKVTYQWTGTTWRQIPGISLLHNGNSLGAPLVAGSNTNNRFDLKTNNVVRLRINSNGSFVFRSLTGAGNALMQLSSTGDATRFEVGTGFLKGNGTSFSYDNNTYLTGIANNYITDAMLRQSAGLSLIGRSANTTGDVADITAATDHHVLRRSGTAIGFGTLNAAAMNGTYSNGNVLQTDGSGGLSWVAPSATPAGSNTEVQFNNIGALGASANLTYSSPVLTLLNNNLANTVNPNYTSQNVILIANNTAATDVVTVQTSPIFALKGSARKTGATAGSWDAVWGLRVLPVTGVSSIGNKLQFMATSGAASGETSLGEKMNIDAYGNLTVGNSYIVGNSTIATNNWSHLGTNFAIYGGSSTFTLSNQNANISQRFYNATGDIHFFQGVPQQGTADQAVSYFIGRPTHFGLGQATNSAGGTSVTGGSTRFTEYFREGDTIRFYSGGTVESQKIISVNSNTSLTTTAWTNAHTFGSYGVPTLTTTLSAHANGNIGINTLAPLSALDASTSFGMGYTSKSTDYTATILDHTIEVTASGLTITLPDATKCTRREYTIKLTASGTGTVATTSSQNIDGSTTYSLSAQYKYLTVQSNGSNWIIIGNN